MINFFKTSRSLILFAGCLVLTFAAVAVFLSVKTNSQSLQIPAQKDKDALLAQINDSVEQPLKVVGNSDSPLRVVQATAKEVTGSDFTRLTRKTTDSPTVTSLPEAILTNVSGKTISQFMLVVRNPDSLKSQAYLLKNLSIAPGETYTVKRDQIVRLDKETVADAKEARQNLTRPKFDSEKYWLDLGKRSDFYFTVGQVTFTDGSKWTIQEGGEVR